MVMVIVLVFSSYTKADQQEQAIESNAALPSTQTQSELERLAPPGKIGTRQAPDEEGWAQKETPLPTTGMSVIFLMVSSCLGYVYLKNKNLQNNIK